jgi:hypothetical protein
VFFVSKHACVHLLAVKRIDSHLTRKLDLYVLNGIMNGQMYRDSVLRDIVVPHFDNHPLASRPLYMERGL